ncbi:MAG: YdcF family protein [Deltaproteobacteria bacterium]|nr:YdcF family protein [Deltaproteobacteria bacterium]
MKRPRRWLATAGLTALAGPTGVFGAAMLARAAMAARAMGRLHVSPFALPDDTVLVLLGARVRPDGTAGRALQARIDAAAAAFAAGTVRTILLSGDHGAHRWDEVGVMRRGLITAGVPPGRIRVAAPVRKTIDSVRSLRGERPAGVPEDAPICFVTQRGHAERTLFLADVAGLPARCLVADGPDAEDSMRESLYEAAGALYAVIDALAGELRR